MRILFDQGVHNMRNKGNNAMLQAAMDRLRQFWPHASLEIITDAPHLTRLYFPDAHPVSPYNLHRIHGRYDKMHRFVPRTIWWTLFEFREAMWHHKTMKTPGFLQHVPHSWFPERRQTGNDLIDSSIVGEVGRDKTQYQLAIREGMAGYNLFVCTGGGYLYDYDTSTLLNVLDRVEVATGLGIPTVMLGQGVGPFEVPESRSRAMQVLSAVSLICIRNRRIGLTTLNSMEISPDRIVFTGDDAVEMAYQARPTSLGTGIGVSIRVAGYTQIEKRHLGLVRKVIHQEANARQAELIAVPISSHHGESDITYINQVLAGYDAVSTSRRLFETPLDVIKRVGHCRIVITCTYHGAIFALAQGIPVVAIANSGEYIDKLSELTDEFGPGCHILLLEDKWLPDKLGEAIESAWSTAEQLRPTMLEVAARQVDLQHSAYKRIFDIMNQDQRKGRIE